MNLVSVISIISSCSFSPLTWFAYLLSAWRATFGANSGGVRQPSKLQGRGKDRFHGQRSFSRPFSFGGHTTPSWYLPENHQNWRTKPSQRAPSSKGCS